MDFSRDIDALYHFIHPRKMFYSVDQNKTLRLILLAYMFSLRFAN